MQRIRVYIDVGYTIAFLRVTSGYSHATAMYGHVVICSLVVV